MLIVMVENYKHYKQKCGPLTAIVLKIWMEGLKK